MDIYLLANVKLKQTQIDKINSEFSPNSTDLIIRFNNSRCIDLFNGKCDILFSRVGNNNTRLNGFVKDYEIGKHTHERINFKHQNIAIHALTSGNDISHIKSKVNSSNDGKINFLTDIIISEYNHNNIHGDPSTGWIGFNYILQNYKADNYYLIGWDFHENTMFKDKMIWNQNSGHDMKGEKECMLQIINRHDNIKLYKKDNFITKYTDDKYLRVIDV